MDALPAAGIAAAAGYLAGSVPFAWLAVKALRGADLRTTGSGNVGATNAARVLGRRWFPVVFALDFAKGILPVILAVPALAPPEGGPATWVRTAAGAGAVLGHLFPAWLGFRGGKGVATGAGVVAGLSPLACGAGLFAFVATAAAFRFVSLGSVVAAVAAPVSFLLVERGTPAASRAPVAGFLALLGLGVILKHLPNLRRIAEGTEPRILAGPPAAAPPPETPRDP
jgi:glycerol-3-phosphate acyltransferase PlsY